MSIRITPGHFSRTFRPNLWLTKLSQCFMVSIAFEGQSYVNNLPLCYKFRCNFVMKLSLPVYSYPLVWRQVWLFWSDLMVKYPRFFGTGYIAFPVLRGANREFVINLEFRPESKDGLILFSADQPDAKFDFFSIALVHGKVEFRSVYFWFHFKNSPLSGIPGIGNTLAVAYLWGAGEAFGHAPFG